MALPPLTPLSTMKSDYGTIKVDAAWWSYVDRCIQCFPFKLFTKFKEVQHHPLLHRDAEDRIGWRKLACANRISIYSGEGYSNKQSSASSISIGSRWGPVRWVANEYLWGARRKNRTSLWKRWRWKRICRLVSLLFYFNMLLHMTSLLPPAQGADVREAPSTGMVSQPRTNGGGDPEGFVTSPGRVCTSVDVRNTPSNLQFLNGCRVVEGFVQIMLIDKYANDSFANYSFPLLTEITGYLLLFRVNGLTTLNQLFPNLTVIRGTELANDYALVVYELMQIQELGLSSLIHIQRGGVRIEKNPNLCHGETIDWKAIAPDGVSLILGNQDPNACTTCPSNVTITLPDTTTRQIQCPTRELKSLKHNEKENHLCWNTKNCQHKCPSSCPKSCTITGECCSPSCYGQCSGRVNGTECVACKNFYYVDANQRLRCVDKCPDHLFLFSDSRCLTADECYALMKPLQQQNSAQHPYVPANGECRLECPDGQAKSRDPATDRMVCLPCQGPCRSICNSMVIESISQIQQLRGCTIIDGSLSIRLRQLGGENVVRELEKVLYSIEEIDGYLSIVRSHALMSFGFFKNLRVIRGSKLNGNPSLSVLDNQNLQELWTHDVRIEGGKVMFNDNPLLCVKKIKALKNNFGPGVEIENEAQLERSNGVRTACEVTILNTRPTKISEDLAIIQWDSFKGLPDMRQLLGYVVYYIEAPQGEITFYDGRDACNAQDWRVDDVRSQQDQDKTNHILTKLEPFTRYAYYVKTYTLSSENLGGQTNITYFRTVPGTPKSVRNLRVTENIEAGTVVVSWLEPSKIYGKLSVYMVTAELNDEAHDMIRQRNYCTDEIKKPSKTGATEVILTTPAPAKDTTNANQVCTKEDCAAICKAAGGSISESSSKIDANEIEMANHFEDWLHNHVYIKNPKAVRRKRRHEDDMGQASGNNSLVFPKTPEGRQPDPMTPKQKVDNVLADGEEYYRVITQPTNVTNISFPMTFFKHHSLYAFRVVACREEADPVPGVIIQDTGNRCGLEQTIIYRTMPLPHGNDIPPDSIQLEDYSNSTQRVIKVYWRSPAKPNGPLVSYSIKYQRSDLDSVLPNVFCVPVDLHSKMGFALLTRLDSGNYSVRIMATSTGGDGTYSAEKFLYLEKHDSDALSAWVWVLCGFGGILSLTLALLYVAHSHRKSNMRLIAQVNPDYAGVTYKVDEWEVPRDDIIKLEELGQGSFGMVYKGIVVKLGNDTNIPCAIKTVNENATDRERDSFLIEANIMKSFKTHHVVRLLGIVSISHPILVVMELMANGDLKSYLRRHRPDYENGEESSPQPPTLKQIYQMAIEIADGMAYLAAKKFVHRDLAARNCMVGEDLTVKIGDFGMTRDIYETDYYRKGTKGFLPVRWMAPESLKDGFFSSASDVFSYGVVLWEMATLASQPYQGLTNDQVLRYVIDGGVMERPENCPDKLYELMRVCWQHRYSARPTFIDIISMLLPDANEHFSMVSFYHSPDAIEAAVAPGNVLEDDVTEPLRANEEGVLDEDDDDQYSIEMTEGRLMHNNGPKPDIRSPHSPQR
uniref:Tyrosine-protein kinase receptor n=1 Tax=Anopheles atroparvus TaxID=41427 RepID=A0AAG5DU37_ANOAO